jgi:hypothetical protein
MSRFVCFFFWCFWLNFFAAAYIHTFSFHCNNSEEATRQEPPPLHTRRDNQKYT